MVPFICFIVVIVGTMAISITAYTIVMLGWCGGASAAARLPHPRSARASETKSLSLDPYLVSTFEYKKGNGEKPEAGPESESGCVVCLSSFKDGDYICQLPRCKHSFHSLCINTWLYSHSDCPVCRAPVDRMSTPRNRAGSTERNSGAVLLDVRS